jgi:hypothetical protein
MKRRVMFAGVAAIAGLLVPLAAATPPAVAGTGVGCTGSDCSVSVWQFVVLKGPAHSSHGGSNTVPIDVPQPPCLWNPIGDATTGSQYIISQFGDVTKQDSLFDVYQSVQQAKKLLANPTPGTWYELPVNPNASPAAQALCAKLPLFAFEAPGVAPPMPNVPPRDLADYAYNNMKLPTPGVELMPGTRGWVNLASYVHLTRLRMTWVSASLGNESVRVTALPTELKISSSSAGKVYSKLCSLSGSKYQPRDHLPTTGAGVPPDCGVLWQAPTTDGTVSATITWVISWRVTNGDVTGAGGLPPVILTGTSQAIRVAEIQSINGSGNN